METLSMHMLCSECEGVIEETNGEIYYEVRLGAGELRGGIGDFLLHVAMDLRGMEWKAFCDTCAAERT